MELSVVIPAAVNEILKEKPELMKKCMKCCNYQCENLVKFICLGCGPREIVDYLNKHPDFAKNTLIEYEKELEKFNADDFNFDFFDDFK